MMPVFDRFVPSLTRPLPRFYAVPEADTAIIAALHRHGITTRPIVAADGRMDRFAIDSVARSPRPFQGHNEIRLAGSWEHATSPPHAGLVIVPTDQPLGRLAAYLLEPESDDGFTTWNAFDTMVGPGRAHPVMRAALP
jgi:hypothetical protein